MSSARTSPPSSASHAPRSLISRAAAGTSSHTSVLLRITTGAAPPSAGAGLPYARVGSAGLSGAVGVDARDFEFTYYLMLIRNKVAQNWAPPAGLETGRQVRAVVYFRVARHGGVSGTRLETPSGVEFFDRASLRAVTLSDPLPPLPLGFPGSDLGIHFGFEYERP